MRVLIADDDPAARAMVRLVVVHAGHEAHAVGDGAAALAALLDEQYDLALLDLQMPELDGDEVARRLRAARPGLVTRLVACTAGVSPGAEATLRVHGFDACLAKPVSLAALRALLT